MDLYSAIRCIFTGGAVQRFGARTPGGGLELWRRLKEKLQGASQEVAMAKAQRFLYPARAANLAVLWDRLQEWTQLGVEVEAEGFEVKAGAGPAPSGNSAPPSWRRTSPRGRSCAPSARRLPGSATG